MNTGSAASRAAAARSWEPVLAAAGGQGRELGEDILAVAHVIAVGSLSGPLTDPGRDPQDRAALAASLLRGRVDDRVVVLLQDLVRGRWSKPVHLLTSLHDLGIEAILVGARSGGELGRVEQELFAVADALERDPELRRALEPSRRTTTEDRVRLAQRAFGPSLSSGAMSLTTWCVRHRTDGGVKRNLRRVTELAAGLQGRAIADVVTAAPLSAEQEERLRSALARRLGTEVELNETLDPDVLGGVRVTVRDVVIDSTVRSSIEHLRTRLAG